jgi:hypothetical protein
MLSRAVVATTIGSFNAFAVLAKAITLCSVRRSNVPDTRHQADLMIDEHNRRVLGS